MIGSILNQTHKFTQPARIPHYEGNELTKTESKHRHLENQLSLSPGKNVQTGVLKVKEKEAKQVKAPAKISTLRADAPPFVPQTDRLLLKKKLPLASTSKWKEMSQYYHLNHEALTRDLSHVLAIGPDCHRGVVQSANPKLQLGYTSLLIAYLIKVLG